jgi:hypothetical protein
MTLSVSRKTQGWMMGCVRNDKLERSRHGLIKVLFQHLPGGTEENHETFQSG